MVARKKARDVQRDFGAQRGKPPGQRAHLFFAVVFAGYYERCHLHVAGGGRQRNGTLDHFQVAAEAPVPPFREPLQVDIHRVEQPQQRAPGALCDRAVRDQNVCHARLVDEPGTVAHVFIAHKRFIVCVRHAEIPPAPQADGFPHECFRGIGPRRDFRPRAGNFGVLAERAAQIAAEAAHR